MLICIGTINELWPLRLIFSRIEKHLFLLISAHIKDRPPSWVMCLRTAFPLRRFLGKGISSGTLIMRSAYNCSWALWNLETKPTCLKQRLKFLSKGSLLLEASRIHKIKAKVLFQNGLWRANPVCIMQKIVFIVRRVTCEEFVLLCIMVTTVAWQDAGVPPSIPNTQKCWMR